MKFVLKSKTNQNISTEIFPPLPPESTLLYMYMRICNAESLKKVSKI